MVIKIESTPARPALALSILSRGTTTRPAARAGTVNFCPKETWLFKLYLGNIFKTSPIRKHRFFSILSRYVVMRARIYDTNTQNNNTISDCVGWWNLANPQGPRNNNCFNILKKLRLEYSGSCARAVQGNISDCLNYIRALPLNLPSSLTETVSCAHFIILQIAG